MARHLFGATAADTVVDLAGNAKSGVVVTFYDAQTAGNQVTDLQKSDGTTAITSVSSGVGGLLPQFYGPDGVTQLWADAGGAARVLLTPTDATSVAVAAGSSAAAAQSTANAAQATANAAIPASAKGAANGVPELDTNALIPTSRVPDLSGTYARVLVESAGTYPARPAVTGPVFYIGTDAPTDAVNGDVHIAA